MKRKDNQESCQYCCFISRYIHLVRIHTSCQLMKLSDQSIAKCLSHMRHLINAWFHPHGARVRLKCGALAKQKYDDEICNRLSLDIVNGNFSKITLFSSFRYPYRGTRIYHTDQMIDDRRQKTELTALTPRRHQKMMFLTSTLLLTFLCSLS